MLYCYTAQGHSDGIINLHYKVCYGLCAYLPGVNGLQQGAAMTPEQSNLAKLLSNMRMASSGPPASMLAAVQAEEQQQQNSPSGTAASALFATVPSDSLQAPLFLQSKSTVSGRSSVTVESGRQYQAAQATARPALLPPNFFTGQQVQHPGQYSIAAALLCLK